MRRRIYIAGPISGDCDTPDGSANVLRYLRNVGLGKLAAQIAISLGFAPFCPMLDGSLYEDGMTRIETIRAVSMAWLAASEGMLVLRGWERSPGTLAEIAFAEAKGIPVFKVDIDLISIRHALEELAKKVEAKHEV